MNFENTANQKSFFYTLKEFAYVIGFVALLGLIGAWMLGLQDKKTKRIRCDGEQLKKHLNLNSYYQDGVFFSGGKMQTDKFSKSGKYSMELTKEDAFGFQYEIPYLKGNENITVSVWRFSNGKDSRKGILVTSATGLWKAGEEVVEKSESGWEKIQFNFSPPPECKNRTLKIYCWNSGHEPIYFDDMEIEIKLEEVL